MKTILLISLLFFSGCLFSSKAVVTDDCSKAPRIWWGDAGDNVQWEKAKVVTDCYDWIVLDQDLHE